MSYIVVCFSMNGDQLRKSYGDRLSAEGRAEQLNKSGGRVALVCESDDPLPVCAAKDFFKRGDR